MQKSNFEGKFLSKLSKIDRQDIESFLSQLVREKNFLEIVFNAMLDGIIVLQPSLEVMYTNNAALELLGINARRKIVGERITTLCDDRKFREEVTRFAIHPERPVRTDIELGGTSPRAIGLTIIPLEADRGPIAGCVIMILHDQTEALRHEEQRRRADRAMTFTTLAAGLAHEIKNPLNSLQIHAQLLRKALAERKARSQKPDMTRVRQSSEIVVEEIERLGRVVDQFLTAVRPTRPLIERANINTIAERVAATMRPEAEERGVELALTLDLDIPMASFDPNQMTQALLNLVKNALDSFQKPEGAREPASSGSPNPTVEIQTGLDGSEFCVRVTDNGRGIPEADLKKIFEPYFTTKFSGTGLGLAIVSRIVEEHHGRLDLTSKPGVGTAVTMTFPLDARPVRLLENKQRR
jgi:two-component system, sporulation sensor kinase E